VPVGAAGAPARFQYSGFVPTRLEVIRSDALACTKCKLATSGRTQVVFGVGDPTTDLMFIGEGPGAEEDKLGEPFVGRSGKLLDRLMLEELGLTRRSCYIANVVKCRPPGNRDPEPDEIDACRPWLESQLEHIGPKVVITLGKFAAQFLLDSKASISKLRGQAFPYRDGVLIPTWHPAYALRGGVGPLAEMRADFVRAKKALASVGSPLAGVDA
jgi:uracil-DNA glycosylase